MLVLYTAIFGGRDAYTEPPPGAYARCVFTDAEASAPGGSRIHFMPADRALGPSRQSKMLKARPEWYLSGFDASVWIDGSVVVQCDVARMASAELAGADIAVFRHPHRACSYAEAETCKALDADDPVVIDAQMSRYAAAGFPRNHGLSANGVVFRRHGAASVRAFDEAWWAEICAGSRRDQLSFMYVAWKLGVKFKWIDGTMASRGFLVREHVTPGR